MFFDLCALFHGKLGLSAGSHVAGHLMRELESSLRAAMWFFTGQPSPKPKSTEGGHEANIRIVVDAVFQVEDRQPIAEIWIRAFTDETRLHELAHRDGLRAPRPLDAASPAWGSLVKLLELALPKYERAYQQAIKKIEELLATEVPSEADLERVLSHLPPSSSAYTRFFRELQHPGWFEPLRRSKAFASPPGLVHVPGSEQLVHAPWYPATYIRAMARRPELQAGVVEVVTAWPSVKNYHVARTVLEVAASVEPALAVQLEALCVQVITSGVASHLATDIEQVILRILQGGHADAALRVLASAITTTDIPIAEGNERSPTHDVKLPIAKYWVSKLLEATIPPLAKVAPIETVQVLSTALGRCVELIRTGHDDEEEDHSHIWAPVLTGRGHADRTDEILVEMLTKAVDAACEQRPELVHAVIDVLQVRRRSIFRRIELRLLARLPASAPDIVADWLSRFAAVFGDATLRFEVLNLAKSAFGQLPPELQSRIVAAVTDGPDANTIQQRFATDDGSLPDSTQVADFRDHWILVRLAAIRDFLRGAARERFQQLAAARGMPESPVPRSASAEVVWIGPRSPMEADALAKLSPEEIGELVKQWKPPGGFASPTPEGLGRALKVVVSQRPREFGVALEHFKLSEPTYVRSVLDGLTAAAEQGLELPWTEVLSFCQWTLKQSDATPKRSRDWDADPDWGWAKSAVPRLLEVGMQKNQIPITQRQLLWSAILSRFDDPDPTADHDAQNGLDALNLSLNCARGKAMHAAMEYALWLRRAGERDPSVGIDPQRGFDAMPEVREVLEYRLDPAVEPSAAVRVVYGRYFPLLVLLDPKWARQSAGAVFGELRERLGRAAWEGYTFDGQVYSPVFDALRDQYAAAVMEIGRWDSTPRARDCDRRLASDLLFLYCWGQIAIDDPESILVRFFATAPSALRRDALESCGFMLARTPQVPEEVIERLRRLWAWRRDATQREGVQGLVEASAFGSWFTADCFPLEWRIAELQSLFDAGIEAARESDAVEVLAKIATSHTTAAARLLRGLVTTSSKLWFAVVNRDEITKVLTAARVSCDEEAHLEADAAISVLAARGVIGF
ncbi:MAG: hypothetical protein IPN34_16750 [Planctomycetes bacterium]|nr:hypothetical protein [Planctomycetota bacterium]